MTKKERNLKAAQKAMQFLQKEDSPIADLLCRLLIPGEDLDGFSHQEELVAYYEALPTNPNDSLLGDLDDANPLKAMRLMRDEMGFNFDGYTRKEVESFCLCCIKKVNSFDVNGILKWSESFGDIDFAKMDVSSWDSLGILIDNYILSFGKKEKDEISHFILSVWGVKLEEMTQWDQELLISNILAEYGYGEFYPHIKESL